MAGVPNGTAEDAQMDSAVSLGNKSQLESSVEQPSPLLTLAILEDITTSRGAHGLKHGDYLRYRRYCTRRLSRTRAACKLRNKPSSQPPHFHATVLTPQKIQSTPRALVIPLVLAERAWAHAMDTKNQQPSGAARARRVVLQKLRRAVAHAEELAMLCKQVGKEETVLEAEAYLRSMHAALALEKEEWAVALAAYQTVEKIYTGMGGVRAGTVGAGIFEQKVEEVGQGIRFCRYNLGRGGGEELLQIGGGDEVLMGKIEKALGEARKRAAQSFGEVEWCGVKVELRSERVREVVLKVEEQRKRFAGGGVEEFDRVFVGFNEALRVVEEEVKEFRKVGGGRVTELEMLSGYLMFYKIEFLVKRNLMLVEALKKKKAARAEDFVRLYENLVGNMTDVLGLKGVEGDAEVCMDAEARRRVFRAWRCYWLARCYLGVERLAEAAALFDRVAVHVKGLHGKYREEADQIVGESLGMKCRAKALAFLEEREKQEEKKKTELEGKRRMIDHLDEYEAFAGVGAEGKVIIDMPPRLEAVPCKPVLFDLAIDGIKFPEERKVEKVEEEEKVAEQPSAFAGTRFGRWWSGKG